MQPLSIGHIGDRSLVLCREVVLISEFGIERLAPRPRYVWLASSPGFPVWVRPLTLHAAQTTLLAVFWLS